MFFGYGFEKSLSSQLCTPLPPDRASRTQQSVVLLTLAIPVVTYPVLGQQVRTCGQGLEWGPDFLLRLPAQPLVFVLGKILGAKVPIEWEWHFS